MNASLKGPLLTLVTILMWASLPLILQQILPVISPRTVVACRFAAAAPVSFSLSPPSPASSRAAARAGVSAAA